MAIPVVQSVTKSTNSAIESFVIDYPPDTEITAGDLLVFVVGSPEQNQSVPYFDAPPTGVTLGGEMTHVNGDAVTGVWWKIADADDADGTQTSITIGPVGLKLKASACLRFDAGDFNAADPFNAFLGSVSHTPSPNLDPNIIAGCTTDEDDCYIGAIHNHESDVYNLINTSGWTVKQNMDGVTSCFGNLFELTAGLPTAGTVPELSIDHTASTKYSAVMFAIAPPAAGGPSIPIFMNYYRQQE